MSLYRMVVDWDTGEVYPVYQSTETAGAVRRERRKQRLGGLLLVFLFVVVPVGTNWLAAKRDQGMFAQAASYFPELQAYREAKEYGLTDKGADRYAKEWSSASDKMMRDMGAGREFKMPSEPRDFAREHPEYVRPDTRADEDLWADRHPPVGNPTTTEP